MDKRRQVWVRVLRKRAVKIYSFHSSEEEKLYSCASHLVCDADSSRIDLVRTLYDWDEMAAAKEAKFFLQQKGTCR